MTPPVARIARASAGALLPVAALAGALLLGARPAEAHLIAARQGTVNVVGAAVYAVVSVPVSALHDADDDHDGVVDVAELDRHEAALRAEIDRRFVVLDGATAARTVRVDLILSPEHGGAAGRATQIVALKHAELDAPPADLRVRSDLFGDRPSERALTITATRHPASGTETQVSLLTPEATELAFFPAPRGTPPEPVTRVLEVMVVAGGILAVAKALAGWLHARRAGAAVPRA